MNISIAGIQPRSYVGEEEKKNVSVALDYIDEAAADGANIICLPEGFPGPFSGPVNYSPVKDLSAKARDHGVYVIAGMVELAKKPNYYHTVEMLIGPDGAIVGKYRRAMPAGPHIYEIFCPHPYEKIMVPGDEPPVFKTRYCRIGITICTEIYHTELSRVLALKGADIIFNPLGGYCKYLYDTWKSVLWTRAIENLAYVVACQHMRLPGDEYGVENGLGTVAGPEEIILEHKGEGIFGATLDLDRLKWLREHDQPREVGENRTIPGKSSGLVRFKYKGMPYSRRPELYGVICRKR